MKFGKLVVGGQTHKSNKIGLIFKFIYIYYAAGKCVKLCASHFVGGQTQMQLVCGGGTDMYLYSRGDKHARIH